MDTVCKARFKETLAAVQKEFQGIFAKLAGGGSAELVLVEAEQLEDAGETSLQSRRGKPQSINLLSGGERALTAISLLFALLGSSPVPSVFSTKLMHHWMRAMQRDLHSS